MGLTMQSTGRKAAGKAPEWSRRTENERVIALAGNPNVGKSTVFNRLTGMNQHTGNWSGKTVSCACGRCAREGRPYLLVDLPGTYSLQAHSAEEEVARDFLCTGGADAAVVVCDATCLERNLCLALQTIELQPKTVLCVNMMDEARKKGIGIDRDSLEKELGVPVVFVCARSGKGLDELFARLEQVMEREEPARAVRYLRPVEEACALLLPETTRALAASGCALPPRWTALRLLSGETIPQIEISAELQNALGRAKEVLSEGNIAEEKVGDIISSCAVLTAEGICAEAVTADARANARDRAIDRVMLGKAGVPVMLLMLAGVFWLTIAAANGPSQALMAGLFGLEGHLTDWCAAIGMPAWLHGALVLGVYHVLAWVVSVMLPPMAIFFPLFTLLEDAGLLPRIAYQLDGLFCRARTCGKQALTMCMGFGCNAAGVVGCRIMDSPRERLIAVVTNSLVPCNGRFPTLIAIIMMFFAGVGAAPFDSVLAALMLTGVIALGAGATFLASRILSATLLKGVPSSFTLELPPYRRPQFGRVIVRSVFDRTLFVLGRAAAVAAPAGLVIWLMANVTVGDMSLLRHCDAFFDPLARPFGLDGVILFAFILGFPANEIVLPIILMSYLSASTLVDYSSLSELKTLLVQNGWTGLTALCTMLFSLMHWPCSTTCWTIARETRSAKWTLAAIVLPTAFGLLACLAVTTAARLL